MKERMKTGKVSVSIKSEYECGHEYEIVYHMKEANIEDIRPWSELPTLADLATERGQPFRPHVEPERTLELSGSYEKMDINGVDWNGALVPCQKCAQPIIIERRGKEWN